MKAEWEFVVKVTATGANIYRRYQLPPPPLLDPATADHSTYSTLRPIQLTSTGKQPIMANTDPKLADSPVRTLQLSALVVMRIIKHSTTSFPTPATGMLVGMDVGTALEVTNSFPFPVSTPDTQAGQVAMNPADPYYQADQAALALAAPRAKGSATYSAEMLKYLREVNVDAQGVGWYMSCSMGNFVSAAFIENQAFYQRQTDERSVALVFDVSRTSQGSLNLHAYRLSPAFVAAMKENKFTTESLQKSNLRYQDILIELPITIHNSHLLTSFLHQLPTPPPSAPTAKDFPASLAELRADAQTHIASNPLAPNYDTLDLAIDPFLEKTSDLLLESIEAHTQEQNNASYYQRSLGREQAKIKAWQEKRKAENALRAQQKQPALPEDEWQKLFKLPTEPSRLESLLIGRQVEQYARQVDGFSAMVSGKMFGVKGGLVPGEM
ncbi:Eukaryotic translation initiation factor 3 subunit H [Salinomyces thailandicus]|uniref:Eukaryotic translation initiation factor 3 subunit H n=1 Tax=Salinomyces thailandicus TaxID=706561 RepID=A0A4U0U181_9PEZI|nr:Eukaryotic translation initiation factor 3 subunit H [Salinomyces thailandica]